MKYAIQRFMAETGEAACYTFALFDLAEEKNKKEYTTGEVIEWIEKFISMGFIEYHERDPAYVNNFKVIYGHKILMALTGRKWKEAAVAEAPYVCLPNQYAINVWSYKGNIHFIYKHDSLGESNCRLHGVIIGKRIYEEVV